jgi:hypothetical protein
MTFVTAFPQLPCVGCNLSASRGTNASATTRRESENAFSDIG